MLWLSWGEVARCSSNSEAFCLAAGSSQAWENRASVGVRWPAGKHPAQQRGNRPAPPPLPADEMVVLFHEGWHLGLSEADTGSLETSRRSAGPVDKDCSVVPSLLSSRVVWGPRVRGRQRGSGLPLPVVELI